jgi:ABC-type glycerol-3-phosphate transport system permease component
MAHPAEALPAQVEAAPRARFKLRISKSGRRSVRLLVSYAVLLVGAMFILFPVVWMVSASFKPNWQIFTRPIIWIPSSG